MGRSRGLVLVIVVATACGRIEFDATVSTIDATGIDARPPCPPGTLALPVAAFDSSPIPGESCAQQNVLAEDGAIAGLERYNYGTPGSLNGAIVSGCITVDFGELRVFDPIIVRALPVADACGQPCGGGLCGTGREFSLFSGDTADTLVLYGYRTFGSTVLEDYPFTLGPLRYVAVCRTTNSRDREDVGVDVVRGTCQ